MTHQSTVYTKPPASEPTLTYGPVQAVFARDTTSEQEPSDSAAISAVVCAALGAKPVVPQRDHPRWSRSGRYVCLVVRAECASNAHDMAMTSCEDSPYRWATGAQRETAVWTCATTSLACSALRRK